VYVFFSVGGTVISAYVLASCGNDSMVRIWRVNVGLMEQFSELAGHGGNVMLVRFAVAIPYLLASTATDNTARLWNAVSLPS